MNCQKRCVTSDLVSEMCFLKGSIINVCMCVPPELITLPGIRVGGEARPGERERGQPSQEGARQERRGSSTRKTWTGCLMAIPAEQTKHPKTR